MKWLKWLWEQLKPDPYLYIAMGMELEGYTDYEIELEIARLKAGDVKKD